MMRVRLSYFRAASFILALTLAWPSNANADAMQEQARAVGDSAPIARFLFDGDCANTANSSIVGKPSAPPEYVRGLAGQGLRLQAQGSAASMRIRGAEGLFGVAQDFSISCWFLSTADSTERMILLAQKDVMDHGLGAQKQAGWSFSMAHGTWAWNLGSGDRRLSYERDNGEHMPLNDGRWHQLAMTYSHESALVRLYYDGQNAANYGVDDARGFSFATDRSLQLGWSGDAPNPPKGVIPEIQDGARKLQKLVDAYLAFDLGELPGGDFVRLIVEPRVLFEETVRARGLERGAEAEGFVASLLAADFGDVERAEAALMRSPYTIHQAFSFMEAAPLMKLYALVDGVVVVDERAALIYGERERLYPSDFSADELTIWDRTLSVDEVRASYAAFFEPVVSEPSPKVEAITVGVWNIFHGGKHFTEEEHGWDSRVAVARILEREGVDVVMMQETYSSGDFIAAELGYTYATTVDWDYLNQGANLSVLSRYPILEVQVPPNSPFMNVGVRIAVSESQDLWVMSNWYGMNQFEDVYSFHEQRFAGADETPVLFGGDFNAVPHTDGGESPASEAMLAAGFRDAYRERHADVEAFPGFTHRSGTRIDQLYYRGAELIHRATRIVDTWPTGFPSDHSLIVTDFELR